MAIFKQYYFSLICLVIISFNTVQLEIIVNNEGNGHDTEDDVKTMNEFFKIGTGKYISGNMDLLIILIILALFCCSLIICPFVCYCRLTASDEKGKKANKMETKTDIDTEPGLAAETKI
ncbi:hypothetical protein Mgra_00006078 [Meloidogyne graminicola]|uniref:Uncharacterized protein n=1 Tax=Meloidogyne graminicola TaxID=189291 RepID=A0A8S9ZM28_9BILA|nr:hypothetical protein Mgra_00006078 [Meloidogyne graminicola]